MEVESLRAENQRLRAGAGDMETLLRDNAALSFENEKLRDELRRLREALADADAASALSFENEKLKDELRKLRDALAEANAAASKAIAEANAANLGDPSPLPHPKVTLAQCLLE
jgi:regulator of replication initiation timing